MSNVWMAVGVMLFGVLIASLSQILLKKSAVRTTDRWYQQYLNARVIGGYLILVCSSLCSVYAYRVLPLSSAPVWQACEHLFVAGLSVLVMRERLGKRKLIGLGLIIAGIGLFAV